MARRATSSRLIAIFDDFGAVLAAASAVRNRRQPDPRDLRRLGIDPEQFARIGK